MTKLGHMALNLASWRRTTIIVATRQTAYSDEYSALFSKPAPAAMPQYRLRIIKGVNYGQVYPIAGSVNLLGRDQHTCHIFLKGDSTISRIHAEIIQRGALYIENKSQYGTLGMALK